MDLYKLSNREMEILEHLASGSSRASISDKLCISKFTYDSYRGSIRIKLDIKSQSDWAQVLTACGNIDKTESLR